MRATTARTRGVRRPASPNGLRTGSLACPSTPPTAARVAQARRGPRVSACSPASSQLTPTQSASATSPAALARSNRPPPLPRPRRASRRHSHSEMEWPASSIDTMRKVIAIGSVGPAHTTRTAMAAVAVAGRSPSLFAQIPSRRTDQPQVKPAPRTSRKLERFTCGGAARASPDRCSGAPRLPAAALGAITRDTVTLRRLVAFHSLSGRSGGEEAPQSAIDLSVVNQPDVARLD